MIITKYIEFDMGHRVSYHKSKCYNPHGHRYKVMVELSGDLIDVKGESDYGMVMDFADVKSVLMENVDKEFDHGFMVWDQDKEMMATVKDHPNFKWIVVPFTPTAENLAAHLFKLLSEKYHHIFNLGLKLDAVHLWETPTSVAICKGDDNEV